MKDAEVEQKLRSLGVPDAVIRYALKHGGQSCFEHGYITFVIFMSALLGGGYLAWELWSLVNEIARSNTIIHANSVDALMYHFDFGWSFLLLGFASIFFAAALGESWILISRRWLAAGFLSVASEDETGVTDYINQKLIQKLRNEKNPERYIRRMALGGLWIFTIAGFSLSVIGAVAALREVQVHSVFTAQSYIRVPFLRWPSPARDWSSATSVGTGCSYSERDNSGTPRYEVTFADGASVDLGYAKPVDGDWLGAVEAIDREVRKSGATFAPLGSLGNEPFHPLCIKAFRAHFSDKAFDRVKRLLRLPG